MDEQINKITEIAVRRTFQRLVCRLSLQPLDIVGLELSAGTSGSSEQRVVGGPSFTCVFPFIIC